VLITNDDGVHSPGLMALFRAMKALAEAVVVAPDRERSAVSHALTIHRPLRVHRLREGVYSVDGTPTDCVAVAVGKLLPQRPQLIVSGINRGGNLGDDLTYSGTVSAAIEGTILGIPSMAVSLNVGSTEHAHYETAQHYAAVLARKVLEEALPYDTLLNVNVPNLPLKEVKGVRFTRQGKRVYDGAVHEIHSPWGELYYWIGGGRPYWERAEDTDIEAVLQGYVSITPIHLDLTNHEALQWLRQRWDGLGSGNGV